MVSCNQGAEEYIFLILIYTLILKKGIQVTMNPIYHSQKE